MCIIEEVGFYESISSIFVREKNKSRLKKHCVEFSRSFVEQYDKIADKFKRIFVDFDVLTFEKIVGNLYLLDVEGYSYEEKLSWCLIHYKTEG